MVWVFGWPFYTDRTAKQAREWGLAPPDSADDEASQRMLTMIYCLEDSHPSEYIDVDMNGEWHPIIALCRDEDAKSKEDAKISRKVPPFVTCLKIQKCLGIPPSEAPQWYWSDDDDDEYPEDVTRELSLICVSGIG